MPQTKQRNSEQRRVVYEVVMASEDHPNAETVLNRAKKLMPSINIATVYRNLAFLSSEGKILRIPLENGDRFDKTLFPHAHFHCENCNSVFDIELEGLEQYCQKLQGNALMTVKSIEVIVRGNCCNSNLKGD